MMHATIEWKPSRNVSMVSPASLMQEVPISPTAQDTVLKARQTIYDILNGVDERILMVVGPCSIHDLNSAYDYASRFKELAESVSNRFYLVMRGYFEKPRTTVGWKGLIKDPDIDGSGNIEKGLRVARQLLIHLNEMGIPIATELLDPLAPQYFGELIAWGAIGARTTESQTHREMASGLPMALGFKNGTHGNLNVAINAMESARHPHHFLGINQEGNVSIVKTSGNPHGHLILRGGTNGPNYDSHSVLKAEIALRSAHLKPLIMVDCSHGNSNKDPLKVEGVFQDVMGQIIKGNPSIIGVMIESHIHAGNQALASVGNVRDLKYGVSISDPCVDWENTKRMILEAYQTAR